MSTMAETEESMGKCLKDMPYEVLFEVFRGLSKDKLYEISKLSSKFKDVAGDTRLWKDVCIKYEPNEEPTYQNFAFEELYSGPWPVKMIDFSGTKVNPPVSSRRNRKVKVTALNLTSIRADRFTIEALVRKYQCTELYLDFDSKFGLRYHHVLEVVPKIFSKQTTLEVLSVRGLEHVHSQGWVLMLARVVGDCKYLKTLDLNYNRLTDFGMWFLFNNLPISLEKLFLAGVPCTDSYFQLLAESNPDLRELRLSPCTIKLCPSLLKFQFLEVLHIDSYYEDHQDISDLCAYLIKFPALKIVYVNRKISNSLEMDFEKLRKTLESHGITVERIKERDWLDHSYPTDGNLWRVTKTGYTALPHKKKLKRRNNFRA